MSTDGVHSWCQDEREGKKKRKSRLSHSRTAKDTSHLIISVRDCWQIKPESWLLFCRFFVDNYIWISTCRRWHSIKITSNCLIKWFLRAATGTYFASCRPRKLTGCNLGYCISPVVLCQAPRGHRFPLLRSHDLADRSPISGMLARLGGHSVTATTQVEVSMYTPPTSLWRSRNMKSLILPLLWYPVFPLLSCPRDRRNRCVYSKFGFLAGLQMTLRITITGPLRPRSLQARSETGDPVSQPEEPILSLLAKS